MARAHQEALTSGNDGPRSRKEDDRPILKAGDTAGSIANSSQGIAGAAPPAPAATPTTGSSETLADSGLVFDLLHFQHRYPNDVDTSDEEAVEEVRSQANRRLAGTAIMSYDELSAAKDRWLLELASGAGPVFGLVAARRNWPTIGVTGSGSMSI